MAFLGSLLHYAVPDVISSSVTPVTSAAPHVSRPFTTVLTSVQLFHPPPVTGGGDPSTDVSGAIIGAVVAAVVILVVGSVVVAASLIAWRVKRRKEKAHLGWCNISIVHKQTTLSVITV